MKTQPPFYKALAALGLLIVALITPQAYGLGQPRELDWTDLMPAEFSDEALFSEYDVSQFAEDDPEGIKRFEAFKERLQSAPVVNTLNGKQVSLRGFALPLESDGVNTQLFLLVPYFGACIHVPPPPRNQIVLVRANPGVVISNLFAAVKVSGRLLVESTNTDLADAGYTLDLTAIEEIDDF